jgi:L-2-hydroxyglutarate oxidase LhgO
VECAVIGAGAVGLAVARALAMAGREVIVLEATDAIGTGTSSRNSEVIHTGIYYRNGILKARLCVEGRRFLYRYCAERGIAHRRIGKLIVATEPDNIPELHRLMAQAVGNGVEDLRLIDAGEAHAMEPEVRCSAALHSPSTGIIDSHGLMVAYRGDAEAHGAMIAFGSPVTGGKAGPRGIELDVGGASPMRLRARMAVNAAGLHAHEVGRSIEGVPPETVPAVHYARGNYFILRDRAPFSHLIYPTHENGIQSIHLTLDLQGSARFGPDVEWVDRVEYGVDPKRADAFYTAVRRYWPDLPPDALQPGYSGMRPRLVTGAAHGQDFVIQGPDTHGIEGLVQLYGIESPGLTASAALGDHVALLLLKTSTPMGTTFA